MHRLKLLIVDDHKDARIALFERLSIETDMEVKEIPASAPESLAEAMSKKPDVVLLDVKTTQGDGLKLCSELVDHYPDIKIMILTSCASPKELQKVQTSGAAGYLFKDLEIEDLLTTIRLTSEKEIF